MCVGVLPNQHRARGGGDGLSESQSTGVRTDNPLAQHSSIHRPNTPQSTGPTLLNPLAQHSSIHWPNTSQSAQRTLPQSTQRNSQSTGSTIHPRTIHPRYDLGGSTSRTSQSTHSTLARIIDLALGCIREEVGHRLRELAEALALEVVGPAAGRA